MVDLGAMTSNEKSARALAGLGALLLLVGVGIRINNALRFRADLGFDAVGNLQYLQHLQSTWALPSPEALWSSAHPPFFYYCAASIWRGLSAAGLEALVLPVLALAISAVGLLVVAAIVYWLRRADPDDGLRSLLAVGLILFLPVHLYMSPMIGEEMVHGALVAWVLVLAARSLPELPGPGEAAWIGGLCGLALLTKLSGGLIAAAVVLTWLLVGARTHRWVPALSRIALMGGMAALVGGWFYAYTWAAHGYFYAQDLAIHQEIFTFPPGERGILDYLRVPLATWTDPQLLNPDLLGSVWGSTYTTIFFDGHRHFLPNSPGASRMGTAILLLALVPTAAFFVGLARGMRRAIAEPGGVDSLLVALVALSLVGYAAFTWGNPWFVTLKGSYLLGLCVPFALYTSEVLAGWLRGTGMGAKSVAVAMGLLALLIALSFTLGPVFNKRDRGVHKETQAAAVQMPDPAEVPREKRSLLRVPS